MAEEHENKVEQTLEDVSTESDRQKNEMVEKGKPNEKPKVSSKVRCRVLAIVSRVTDDEQNNLLTTAAVEQVIQDLMKDNLLVRSCWILHDEDKAEDSTDTLLSEKDTEENLDLGNDNIIKPHIHWAMEFTNSMRAESIYNRLVKCNPELKLDIRRIQKPKERYYGFEAIINYYLHTDGMSKELGKHPYDAEKINWYSKNPSETYKKTVENYRKYKASIKSSRIGKERRIELIERVAETGISLREVRDNYGYAFLQNNEKSLRKARLNYIKEVFVMPARTNIYICGQTGSGKSTLGKIIPEGLFPELDVNDARFMVGQGSVRFDEFDYQKSIVFDDVRGDSLGREFGYEGLLNLMDVNPPKRSFNIKFGNTILTQELNIFTSTQSFSTFLDEVINQGKEQKKTPSFADEYESREQYERRIQMVIEVSKDDVFIYRYIKGNNNAAMIARNISASGNYSLAAHIGVNLYRFNQLTSFENRKKAIEMIVQPIKELYEEIRLDALELVDTEDFLKTITSSKGTESLQELKEKYEKDYKEYCEKADESNRCTYQQWLEIGRPFEPGQNTEEQYEKMYLNDYDKRMYEMLEIPPDYSWDEIDEELRFGEELTPEEIEEAEEEFRDYSNHLDSLTALHTLYRRFEKQPTIENFQECVQQLKNSTADIRKNPVVTGIKKVAYEHNLLSANQTLEEYIANGMKRKLT